MIGRAFVIGVLALPVWAQESPDGGPSDDYTFCRRVTLDLAGRLPTPDEIRALVRSKDRQKKVDELLASPEAALYHADLWMQWLLDHEFENRDFYRIKVGELHAWLRSGFDRPMGEFVRALVLREGPAGNFARKHLDGVGPPVKLALLTARLFLGRDLRCAQCHDHPSEGLTQEEFWGFVAFFGRGTGGLRDHLGEIRSVPRYFDGREGGDRPLESLAGFLDWRPALSERYWKLLTGHGGHPQEIESAESPRDLLRAIVARPEYRARKGPFKLMNTVQFMNALTDLFDLREAHRQMAAKAVKSEKVPEAFKDEEVIRLFFHKWAKEMILPKGQSPEEVQAHGTVRLSLKLMNNAKVSAYFSVAWGTLRHVLGKKVRAADRVEELFLTVIGRPPSKAERELFAAKDDAAFEDVFWALVNSAEFLFVS
ncbi:MAG TPA: DUF1549 domain-containing protein [Planctomycetota bacterium]|nr:DUF1549 domain-containing protein [Planctomycetota bacterium]